MHLLQTPALRELLTDVVRNVIRPTATAAQIAEKRFNARAGFRARQQDERTRQRVIKGVRLTRTHFRPEDRGLEPACIAKIDPWQQRLRVGPERQGGNN